MFAHGGGFAIFDAFVLALGGGVVLLVAAKLLRVIERKRTQAALDKVSAGDQEKPEPRE
jgi:hypothetical protein